VLPPIGQISVIPPCPDLGHSHPPQKCRRIPDLKSDPPLTDPKPPSSNPFVAVQPKAFFADKAAKPRFIVLPTLIRFLPLLCFSPLILDPMMNFRELVQGGIRAPFQPSVFFRPPFLDVLRSFRVTVLIPLFQIVLLFCPHFFL